MPRSPLVDAWRRAMQERRRPLQIPGHKNRYADPLPGEDPADVLGSDLLRPLVRDDIPLQGGVDDNAMSGRYLEEAEELWAQAVGADHARFVVGGSSQGNMGALSTVAHPDRLIAVDRTSHRSVHAGLIISGARPHWVYPQIHPEFGLPIGLAASAVDTVPVEASALYLTSPSYVGTLTDVTAVSERAHARDLPLVVDQAWGAHLGFLPGRGAIAEGADVSVTSVHKALMGYSQTAVVTMRDARVLRGDFDQCIDLVATTSPSGTLLASIDATRAVLERDGCAALDRAIEAVAVMRGRLAAVPGIVVLDDENVGCAVDPLKVTMWLPRTGVSGLDLARELWALGMGAETASRDALVLSLTVMDEPQFLADATDVLVAMIERERREPREPAHPELWRIEPEVVVTPREAFFAKRRRIRLDEAIGEVSTEQFCPYPPGVPLIAPGERITASAVEAIHAAARVGRVAYNSDRTLETLEIIDEL